LDKSYRERRAESLVFPGKCFRFRWIARLRQAIRGLGLINAVIHNPQREEERA
jgi:hypothetical protein